MTLSSMTGFARTEGRKDTCSWTWEVKSVNAKGLDVRCRLANGFERLEKALRDRVAGRFKRGNVMVSLNIARDEGAAGFRINQVVLGELLATLPEIQKQLPDAGPPSIDGLLGLRGVIEPVGEDLGEEARDELEAEMLDGFDAALEALSAMRDDEGARLAGTLDARLDDIARFCGEAEKLAAMQPDAIRERLQGFGS